MNALRSLILLPFLLMQAWPVMLGAASAGHGAVCAMDCCAPPSGANTVVGCGCMTSPGEPTQRLPAAPSSDGVGKVPQPAWVSLASAVQLFNPSIAGETTSGRLHSTAPIAGRQVRLTVLFCSFLT